MPPPLLEMRGISKRFPGVQALDHVDFEVWAGEIVGLIGENGAGKSTLMKILGGVYEPDEGEIRFDGTPIQIRNPAQSLERGVSFIHQELNVLDNLDVAANVFLGREPVWGGILKLVDNARNIQETRALLQSLKLDVSPTTPLRFLTIAQRQMVEIAKALSIQARILIMDEPTSSLTLSEAERLFEVTRDLARKGVGVIFISHRLGEIQGLADRVVGLRDGHRAGALSREEIDHDRMVRLMVGRELTVRDDLPVRRSLSECLTIRNLRTRRFPKRQVNLSAACGEILCLAGLVGSGRSELAQSVFGVEPPLEGEIRLCGQVLSIRSAHDAIAAGIFLVPEDRRETGLILEMSLRENLTLPDLNTYAQFGLLRAKAEKQAAAENCRKFRIKSVSFETPASSLSGGNQQKLSLARWLALKPKVMILDEPTRGVDVGAKAEIYSLIHNLADSGVVLLVISSDLEEILRLADRVAVMHEGGVTGFLERDECSEESIMHLAVGSELRS